MCRWLAYLGSSLTLDTVLTKPDHALIDQSIMSRQEWGGDLTSQFHGHDWPTNVEGWGMAWSGINGIGRLRELVPAYDSANMRSLAPQIASDCFFAHVRAASGGDLSQDNNHPFVHDGWMFQHNGGIGEFAKVKRDLAFDVDASLYPFIKGSTDTEVMFHLALTYGLADDPVGALKAMIDRVERARAERGVTERFVGAIAATDGETIYAVRYSSPDGTGYTSPTLYHSVGPETLHVHGGETETLPDDAQLIVSEPLELHYSKRRWTEFPDHSVSIFRRGAEPEIRDLG